ncbi:MAG: NlpC/P60 family protein, partial [Acidimicrobiia bacterium]
TMAAGAAIASTPTSANVDSLPTPAPSTGSARGSATPSTTVPRATAPSNQRPSTGSSARPRSRAS